MLAERLPGLLPPMSHEEAMTVTRIHSAAGCAQPDGVLLERPLFRAPHGLQGGAVCAESS